MEKSTTILGSIKDSIIKFFNPGIANDKSQEIGIDINKMTELEKMRAIADRTVAFKEIKNHTHNIRDIAIKTDPENVLQMYLRDDLYETAIVHAPQYLHKLSTPIPDDIILSVLNKKGNEGIFQQLVNPSPNVINQIVAKDVTQLAYVENPSERLFATVQHSTGNAIKHMSKEPNEEFLLEALFYASIVDFRKKGFKDLLAQVTNPSEKLKLACVQLNGFAIKHVKNPSEEIKLAAVKSDGMAIEIIKDPSLEIKLEAVKNNGLAIQFIPIQPEIVQLAAVKENGLSIEYMVKTSNEVQIEAVKNDPNSIKLMSQNPCAEAQKIAVIKDVELIKYIDKPIDGLLNKAGWIIYPERDPEKFINLDKIPDAIYPFIKNSPSLNGESKMSLERLSSRILLDDYAKKNLITDGYLSLDYNDHPNAPKNVGSQSLHLKEDGRLIFSETKNLTEGGTGKSEITETLINIRECYYLDTEIDIQASLKDPSSINMFGVSNKSKQNVIETSTSFFESIKDSVKTVFNKKIEHNQLDPLQIKISGMTEEQKIKAVKDEIIPFSEIKNPSLDVQLAAIEVNPKNVLSIHNLDPSLHRSAVELAPEYIHLLYPRINDNVIISAINSTYFKDNTKSENSDNIFKKLVNPSEKVIMSAVVENIELLQYIEKPSVDLVVTVYEHNHKGGNVFKYMAKEPNEEFLLETIKEMGKNEENRGYRDLLTTINNPSEEVKLGCIKLNGQAIQHIKNPTDLMKFEAVRNDAFAIQFIAKPSAELQVMAVTNNPKSISVFKDHPCPEAQLEAVKQDVDTIKNIKKPIDDLMNKAGWIFHEKSNNSNKIDVNMIPDFINVTYPAHDTGQDYIGTVTSKIEISNETKEELIRTGSLMLDYDDSPRFDISGGDQGLLLKEDGTLHFVETNCQVEGGSVNYYSSTTQINKSDCEFRDLHIDINLENDNPKLNGAKIEIENNQGMSF